MYFFDPLDFPFPKGSSYNSDITIYNRDINYYSHYYMNDFVFVNNPDGTFGVYYDANNFTGSTDSIQNFTTQITEEFCSLLGSKFDDLRKSFIGAFYSGYTALPNCNVQPGPYNTEPCAYQNLSWFQTSTYENIPSCYWDQKRQKCASAPDPLDLACCGDDFSIDFNSLLTEPITNATTNEKFDNFLTTELIDAKNRKTLSGYPTIRALYDRYTNSVAYTGVKSSAYDYSKMDGIANMVGTYWVDMIEQVIPATTIWGSVKIYSNTMFDQQKFMYRKGTLFTCESVEGAIGSQTDVGVDSTTIYPTDGIIKNKEIKCTGVYMKQINNGSEFIGKVTDSNSKIDGGAYTLIINNV